VPEIHDVTPCCRKLTTLLGATIGDVITSVIATGSEAGINIFDYITTLQREKEQVKANPENYLPWNYLDKN